MTRVIEEVAVRIGADTRGLTKGMKKAKREVGVLSGAFKRLGFAIAGAFGARAVINGFRQTLDSADKLIKTAKGVGFTVDEYQRLVFALDQVGVSAGSAKIAIGDFQKRLSKAVAGVSPQFQKAFEQAGLDTSALSKMSPAAAFTAAMTQLSAMRNDPTIAGLTGNVFEEQSGKDVLQVLRQWEKYVAAREKFDRRVGGLSKRQVDNLQGLREETKLYGKQVDMLKMQVVADMAPEILDTLKTLNEADAFGKMARGIGEAVKEINVLVSDIKWLGDVISDLPIPDWLKGTPGALGRFSPTGLLTAPTDLIHGLRNAVNPPTAPGAFAGTPWGRQDFAGTQTTTVNIRAARGSSEITDKEARRIRKQFDNIQRNQ